jgi:FkbM family methyltransferase
MNPYIQLALKGIHRFFTNSNERVLFRLSLFNCNSKRYKAMKINFLGFRFLVPDCQSFFWQFKEIFVEEYYSFESATKTPLILDCGANIGTSCVYFKKLYPEAKIIAFEANPKIAGILKENIKNNNFNDIEVIDKAVWINNEGIEIGIEHADASSIYKNDNKVKVNSVRLKDFLQKYNQIDLLKMDIEGAETEVIKDCAGSLGNVKNLFIEYHSYTQIEQELGLILNILRKNNFRFFIKQGQDRQKPFVNRINKSFPDLDLQINIFAYRLK